MVKRFSYIAAYILLLLMPLQALAAVSLMTCHYPMQPNQMKQLAKKRPCHAVDREANKEDKTRQVQHQSCEARCAAMCANTHVLIMDVQASPSEDISTAIDTYHDDYTSIAQQHLQRPPISFI